MLALTVMIIGIFAGAFVVYGYFLMPNCHTKETFLPILLSRLAG